jgi:hypothetical protein
MVELPSCETTTSDKLSRGRAPSWRLPSISPTDLEKADADAARVRALAAYKDFFTLWKDADPDIPILKQAEAEYLCFLAWVHSKSVSLAEEQGTTGLIAIAGIQAYVLHSPAFWALAIIAFGVGFFLFRDV